jgi:hypothetical protein
VVFSKSKNTEILHFLPLSPTKKFSTFYFSHSGTKKPAPTMSERVLIWWENFYD